jgi:ribosomal-protein-alanine N-acetyltransferase
MAEAPVLRTSRLLLRPWRDNADPKVMEYFPSLLTQQQSDEVVARICRHFATHGFGLWVVEAPGVTEFAGFVGLAVPGFEAHFTPCVEVGWRLSPETWGRGYATEGATAALDFAFGEAGLREIVSFTVPANLRSRAVMERLGLQRSPDDDFDHPRLPPGHRLQRHVLYRISSAQWRGRARRG